MAAFEVADLSALEILDSRGRPTLAVSVRLADGTAARAGVPSGASTGSREAVERRDGDPARYEGKGVLGAVASVNGELADLLRGRPWASLAEVDQAMIDLDGTANKARLGANATVGTSMALARALAASAGVPLWRWLRPEGVTASLPVPHFNVLNGGVHAPNELDFQEFMIAPVGAPSMAEAVRAGAEVYSALRRELSGRHLSTGLGDEGGFAPEIAEPEEVLALLVQAISDAGYKPGTDGVSIALDPASSEFRQSDGRYRVAGQLLSSSDMIDRYTLMTTQFPVHLIEDGLGEDDDDGWIALTARLGGTTELVGDDIFCTNPAIITRAIARGIGNSCTDQAQPDRHRHRDAAGHGHLPRGRVPAVRLASLRGDRGPLHRRPGGRHRLRPPQDRRSRPRRARGQVQPTAGDRRRGARPPLRNVLTGSRVYRGQRPPRRTRRPLRGSDPCSRSRPPSWSWSCSQQGCCTIAAASPTRSCSA